MRSVAAQTWNGWPPLSRSLCKAVLTMNSAPTELQDKLPATTVLNKALSWSVRHSFGCAAETLRRGPGIEVVLISKVTGPLASRTCDSVRRPSTAPMCSSFACLAPLLRWYRA
jgi:hypothetical protein